MAKAVRNFFCGMAMTVLFGCAAEQADMNVLGTTATLAGTKNAANPTAVPPNYRKIVALKLATVFNSGGITRAEISQPTEAWMGLIRGGMLPIVCATVIQRDVARSNWIFTFKNGQLDEAINEPGAIYCMGKAMSPLPEFNSRR